MGKGDQKSKRGKIIRGTYGVRRLKKSKKRAAEALAKISLKTAASAEAVSAASPEVKVIPAQVAAKTVKPRTAAKSTAKPAADKTKKETKTPALKEIKAAAAKETKTDAENESGAVTAKEKKAVATKETKTVAPKETKAVAVSAEKPVAKPKKPAAKKE